MKTFACFAFRRWARALPLALAVLFTAALNSIPARGQSSPVGVLTYDIQNTPRSGFGCWAHTYNGTITDTGRVVGGSYSCTVDGNNLADYTGGGGTLNDGIFPATTDATHLFTTRADTNGIPANPVITLHLANKVSVAEVGVHQGDIDFNVIPGALVSATVEIGGVAISIPTTPVGMPNIFNLYPDSKLDLRGTPLASIPTDTIILRDFSSTIFGFPFDQFSLGEVTVAADPLAIAIDIKPGDRRNVIWTYSDDLIPVALLSGPYFDPRTVIPNSVTFGRTGNEASLAYCQNSRQYEEIELRDFNGDGVPDLVCWFKPALTGFQPGDLVGIFRAITTPPRIAVMGQDNVCINCRSDQD